MHTHNISLLFAMYETRAREINRPAFERENDFWHSPKCFGWLQDSSTLRRGIGRRWTSLKQPPKLSSDSSHESGKL